MTGVQTCALPISEDAARRLRDGSGFTGRLGRVGIMGGAVRDRRERGVIGLFAFGKQTDTDVCFTRSEPEDATWVSGVKNNHPCVGTIDTKGGERLRDRLIDGTSRCFGY